MIKTYYAEKEGLDPKDIAVVSIMPCTAKKFEAQREELAASGHPDVDLVLTTRELARVIRAFGIDFTALPDSDFDHPLGISTGASTIFGATGGVMEAALRTVADVLTGESSDSIDYMDVRGNQDGIKELDVSTAADRYSSHPACVTGKSALTIFDRHANLKYKYGNRHFWCRGYYVDTVGRNKNAIAEYIRNQLQEDIADDQISMKEYIDPFTGGKNK